MAEVGCDEGLLEAWAAGDNAAGSRLFDRHFRSVARFFSRKIGDDVEDLVQQTFTRCVENIRGFRRASSFRTYLFGVARNVLREHVRSRLRGTEALDEVCAVQIGKTPTMMLAQEEEKRLLLEALRRLPLDTQILLELAYWESLSGPEIGEVLGINENTARSRLRRARELLGRAVAEATANPSRSRTTWNDLDGWAAGLRAQLENRREP